jgi:hypothetical protein
LPESKSKSGTQKRKKIMDIPFTGSEESSDEESSGSFPDLEW